jgi:hypothetical protein
MKRISHLSSMKVQSSATQCKPQNAPVNRRVVGSRLLIESPVRDLTFCGIFGRYRLSFAGVANQRVYAGPEEPLNAHAFDEEILGTAIRGSTSDPRDMMRSLPGLVLNRREPAAPSRLGREVPARSHSAPERMPLPGTQLWRPVVVLLAPWLQLPSDHRVEAVFLKRGSAMVTKMVTVANMKGQP